MKIKVIKNYGLVAFMALAIVMLLIFIAILSDSQYNSMYISSNSGDYYHELDISYTYELGGSVDGIKRYLNHKHDSLKIDTTSLKLSVKRYSGSRISNIVINSYNYKKL